MKYAENQPQEYPLNQIYFYLAEGCNLRCRHCWIAPKYQSATQSYPVLDVRLFHAIIQQAKLLGLSGVKLTGGEPLLHPKINKILEIVRSEELRLNLETNGTLCTLELAEEIAKGENPHVSVSLDGANAVTHEWVRGVKGSFESTIEGIRNLIKVGLKPQIIMSVMKCNRDQLENVVRLAESLGAASVKFNIILPIGRGEDFHAAMETLSIEDLVDLGQWVENILSNLTKISLYYSHPLAFKPLGRQYGDKGDGCGVCKILSILSVLSDGSYSLCGIGNTVPELIFGHASRDSLADVWQMTPILNELRKGIPSKLEGICGNCLMKNICSGSCIAQNYYSSKNLWAPYWYCQEARKKGLFPETRINPLFSIKRNGAKMVSLNKYI